MPPQIPGNGDGLVPKGTNPYAVASLVFGLLTILPGLCLSVANIFFALPGLGFGVVATRQLRRHTGQNGSKMATAGMICSAFGALLSLVLAVVFVAAKGPQAVLDLIADVATALSG